MTHPTPEAVAAMIAELREWADNFPVSEPTFASAADLLAALSAERDALTERCGRAERERDEHATDDFDARQYLMDAVTKAESDLAAARATIAMEINRRELAEEDLEAAHMVFDDYKAPRIDDGGTLSIAGRLRATIARLTREKAEAMEAEREACALIAAEASFGIDILVWVNSTKQGITAHVARAIARAIRARANTKEPTT